MALTLYAVEQKESSLKVKETEFEPIRQGKNVVKVQVLNNSDSDRIFGINIHTKSPEYGRKGIGWGTTFYSEIKAGQSKLARFAYKIQGSITDSTWIELTFYDIGPAKGFDIDNRNKIKKNRIELGKKKYTASDLDHFKAPDFEPASQQDRNSAFAFFTKIQLLMEKKQVEKLWQYFTKDYRQAEFKNRTKILQAVLDKQSPHSIFYFNPDEIINLKATTVLSNANILRVSGKTNDQNITIDIVNEDENLKVDWIGGYLPQVIRQQNWQKTLLPNLQKKSTEHFDIYYFKGSTAEKEINQIVKQKEKGVREICKFLGKESDTRIHLVLFEDGKTKKVETGHQGSGWAFDSTIVEIYNEEQKLDPYHEAVHILMESYGNPPALFNEGFATYMSERLGAHGLEYLGGGQSTIYERVRELKSKGKWIRLEKLITYTEIGSKKTKPPIAYPEAASFVKFLVDRYGKDKFLQAYKTLKNSKRKKIQERNIEKLTNIYGKSLKELKEEWESYFDAR
jgi:hypothetical protein